MHAYLIVGKNEQKNEKEVESLVKKLHAKRIDMKFKTIAEAREISVSLKLKKSIKTAIVLKNVDEASHEALNSFLKSLEEKSKNTIFILTSKNVSDVLHTIKSRSQIINVAGERNISTGLEKMAEDYLLGNSGEKLRIAGEIKKRDEAKEFLEAVLIVAKKKFLKDTPKKLAAICDQIHRALEKLNKNCNVNLTLTWLTTKAHCSKKDI